MKKWNEFLERMKLRQGFPKKNQLLILFLCGLLLFVIVWPVPDSEESSLLNGSGESRTIPEGSGGTQEQSPEMDGISSEAYAKRLERRLAEALEHVDGVGKAEVVITMKSTGQKIVEKDRNSSSQTSTEEDQNGGTRVVEDRSFDAVSIYTQGSDGSQAPYVSQEMLPEIEGVVVIADGGDNAVVVQNVTEAIQALFGVEAHKIKIMKRTDT